MLNATRAFLSNTFMTIGLAHHKLEEAQSHKQATIDQIVPPHGASD
jgi:hypothetical protein